MNAEIQKPINADLDKGESGAPCGIEAPTQAALINRIVLLAIRFTAANDTGDELSDKLDDEEDTLTDEEVTGLEMASEHADNDYNESKALLFAAVRELAGRERKSKERGWERDLHKAKPTAA